jgi:copper resistance protein D
VPAPLGAITGWLLFTALVLASGSLTGRWLIVPRVGSVASSPLDPAGERTRGELLESATRLGLLAALVLPVAMGLVFLRQLAEFRDPFASWTEDALLLSGTAWGLAWKVAAVASVAAPIVFALCRPDRRGAWAAATLLVIGLCTFPALTGHAAGTGALRPVTLVADTLHVLAAGCWMGGLAFVLFAERRRSRIEAEGSLLPELVPVFSRVAVVSVAVLVATGVLASWVHLGSLAALSTTDYGRFLSIKLILVAMVMALGVTNWKVLAPRLGSAEGVDALRRAALAELALGQLVLLVTAVLVRTSPLGPGALP